MFTVEQIINWTSGRIANPASGAKAGRLTGLSTLGEAGLQDVAFFFSKHYQDELLRSRAGVIITGNAFVAPLGAAGIPQWKNSVFIACNDPYAAMAVLSSHFSKVLSTHDHQHPPAETFVHPTAVVAKNVKLGKNIHIGANAVIEEGSELADGVVIYPQSYVGPHCKIGEGTVLFARVTLYEKTIIGKRCRLHSGSVVGADGFGYSQVFDSVTKLPVDHQKVFHVGNVVIGDEVEVGANSAIDRGTLGSTFIRSKTKIDNLVQVGHNCDVGEGSILCGCSGMAGSSSLGKFVMLGAQSGTANQVHVGDYSKLAGYAGATKDIPPHSDVAGLPARPASENFKILAIQNKMLRERSGSRGKKS